MSDAAYWKTAYEAMVGVINEKNREIDDLRQVTYTHRNGVTEPPTEDSEFYWFVGHELGKRVNLIGVFMVDDGYARSATDTEISLSSLRGSWWGPLDRPWLHIVDGELKSIDWDTIIR